MSCMRFFFEIFGFGEKVSPLDSRVSSAVDRDLELRL